MKIFDFEKGKIFGINFFDLFVIITVIFIGFMLYKTFSTSYPVYGGDEIHKADRDFKKLLSKGILVESEIEGKIVGLNKKVKINGIIIKSSRQSLTVREKDLSKVVVGGKTAEIEEIAAYKIIFKPLYKSTARFTFIVKDTEFSDFLDRLENLKKRLNAKDIIIYGHVFGKNVGVGIIDCYYCIEAVAMRDSIYLNHVSIRELRNLNFYVENSDLVIYVGFEECLNEKEIENVEKIIKDFGSRGIIIYSCIEKIL